MFPSRLSLFVLHTRTTAVEVRLSCARWSRQAAITWLTVGSHTQPQMLFAVLVLLPRRSRPPRGH